MKRKLFFITFLMLFCSSMFGQHWTMTEADIVKYTFNTTVNAAIKIQGQTPENIEELEIAAFHNGVLRGVASPVVETLTGQYVAYLVVYSSDIGELITFKLYDPSIDKEYDTDYTINFTQTVIGEPIDPVIINFYTKHWNYVYNPEENYMALPCIIKVDGNLIDKSNYEIAAFSGNQLRGVANPELEPVINIYKAMLKIDGTNGETISFKLFDVDAQKELETDYTIPYDFDYFAGDVEIEFKNNPVAMITNATGNHYFSSLEAAVAAAQNDETIKLLQDVTLEGTLTIEKSITIDGNGFEILPADDSKTYNSAIMVGNSGWGDDHGEVITLNNIEFNNWKSNYGVVRAQGVTLNMTACKFNGNDVSNAAYGVLSLNYTDATVTNSIFKQNQDRAIDINYNVGDNSTTNAEVTIVDCIFEENVSDGAGIVVRNKGEKLVVKDSKFLNNTVTTNGNAATIYAGWGTSDVITGCYFDGNNVTTSHATTKRFASAIFCDGCAVTGNAFGVNTATRNGETIKTTVAVGAYYGAANISKNYWGGSAPVPGEDYTVEFTNNNVAINDYYKEYSEGTLSDKVTLNNVAKAGKYYYESITAAFAAVQDGETVTMLHDVNLSETIKVNNNITLDLNGKTITGTDNETASFALFEVQPSKELTVKDENNTGKITLTATNNRGWNAYSSVISNQRGKLTVNGGTIEHLGGTDMAYAIDNLTNGKATSAITTIKGGTIESKYIGIRQFLNGVEATNELNITAGSINGENSAIYFQSPSVKANTGTLVITSATPIINNRIYMDVTEGATEWPVEVSIDASALAQGVEIVTSNIPAGYELKEIDGVYSVYHGVAKIGNIYYDDLSSALKAITSGCTLEILTDITIASDWDCRNTGAKIGVPVTINGNGKTIKFTGKIYDANWNTLFRFEDVATVKNLTLDASAATDIQRGITFKTSVTVDNCTLIGNGTTARYAVIVGEGAGAENIGNVTANITNSTFKNWKNGVTDNMNGQDMKEFAVTGCTFDNTDVIISAYEKVTFTGNNMSGNSYVDISSYTVPNNVQVVANNNTNLAANTETECNQIAAPLANINAQDGFLTPVAEINGKYFTTLQAAINAAAEDETVKLLADVNYSLDPSTFTAKHGDDDAALFVLADDKLTIDLNGNTISVVATLPEGAATAHSGAIINNGDLTIDDSSDEKEGKVTFKYVGIYDEGNKRHGVVMNLGTLTVNAGTLENVTELQNQQAIDNTNYNKTEVSVVINGGTIKSAGYYAIDMVGYYDFAPALKNSVVINDGTIDGGVYARIQNNTNLSLNITGGVIKSDFAEAVRYRVHYPGNTHSISITGGEFSTTNAESQVVRVQLAEGESLAGFISAGTFSQDVNEFCAAGFMCVENDNGTYGVVVDPDYGMVAKIGETRYATLAAAFADAAQTEELTTIELLPVTIEEDDDINTPEKTIKLPATIKNVIVKGADNNTSILKNLTIQNAQGGTYDMSNITFDGVVFDNSNIVLTGWRTGFESLKNLIVKNCIFSNIVRSPTNLAAVHINVAADKAVNGFTFINNVIDGVTGAQNSGIYGQFTGEVIVKDNTINNVAFRPYVIQLTTDDGIADNFTVTGNTFSGSAAGRAQGLGNNAEGTDAVTLTVSNNIFKGITNAQQICYWNFNEATTTATLEKNYYDIDVLANPNRIYYNGPAQNISELSEMGIFPIYTELNADGTINEESLFNPVAYVGTVAYETLAKAFAGQEGTIVLLENIELTEGVVVAADKTFTLDLNGKTITGTPTEAAAFAVIANKGNLTVTDNTEAKEGKILCNHNLAPSTGYAVNTITNSGTLTIEAGTIENKSTYTSSNQIGYAIDNNSTTGNAVVTIKGGKVTASGSVYYDGIRQFCNSTTLENSVTIEGGEVSTLWIQNPSNDNEKDVKGSFAITGGTLNSLYLEPSANFSGSISGGHVGSISRHQSGDNDIVSFITGGTFGMDVTEFCAFNYVCTQNTDGTYGVQYKPLEDNAFVISTLHELEAFRDAVNAGNDFAGQTVVLSAGVDLNPTRAINIWEPIGTQANPFKGTFDGGDHTISNLVVDGENYLGLFGKTNGATIKNVKINNVTINGVSYLGAIVGMGYTGIIDNCHVTGDVKIAGNYMVGGINGQGYATVNNSSVVANDNSFVKAIHDDNNNEGDNVGGIVGHCGETNTLTANTVKNITISGTRKVGGIVGIANQGTKVENCVVEDVTIETSATEAYANDNITTMSIGALIGQYQNNGSAGTVKDCMVKNVEFKNVNDVDVSVGPITGGSRGGTDGMLAPTDVTASNNNIYMSTITGSNNLYLMNAVAKIGETKYYTLQEAVAASETNETTIDVIANTAETINVQEGANITINNINLTGSILAPNATLKIVNGSIVNNNSNVSAIEINAGILNLEGVDISSARHAVRIDGDVEATIDGGTYKPTATSGTRHAVNVSGGAEVTIKNGTFEGPAGTTMDSGSAVCVQAGATVTIEDGDFSKGKNATLGVSGTMIVKGGTFDQDVTAYCPNGYVCQMNADNKYEVFFAVAQIGEVNYPSLQKAFNDVDANETITIISNVEESEVILPATLENVIVTASENVVVKNTVIKTPEMGTTLGFAIAYEGLTFNNVNFDNSRVHLTGWANDALSQSVSIKNLVVTNCEFNNIANEENQNYAALHLNVADGVLENLTFTNNKVNGITGGESAALYGNFTGNVTITGNVIRNTSGSSMVVGYSNATINITDNILENWALSGKGRAIRLDVNNEANASTVEVSDNAMIHANAPEEFVKSTGSNTTVTLNENYWYGKSPREEGMVTAAGVVIDNYYKTCTVSDDDFELDNLVVYAKGTITHGYVNTYKIWGEGSSNSQVSFVVKVYAGETLLGQASLNDEDNIIDGDIPNVTWGIPYNTANTDEYWTVEWFEALSPSVVPTTVKLYVDGEFVAENTIKMSAPDDLNPIEWEDIFVAKIEEADTYFTSLQAAINAADGKTVVVLDNITLTETVTVAAGTTVTLDLNGKTVSQTKEQTTGYQMILNDGNLTIVDNTNEKLGKISYTDSGNGGEYVSNTITNRGTITVKSGTIENLSSQTVAQNGYPYAIDSSIWGDASEVNTIVEGGKVHGATYSAIRLRADSTSEPVNVTVSGGEIVGTIEVQVPSSTVAGKGALVISGGKLSNSGTSNVLFFFGSGASAENIEVSVTGGEFTGNITISSSYPIGDNFNNNFITGGTFSTDVNDYCHEYYDAIQGDDNLWRVEQVLFAQTREFISGWNWFSSYINLSKDNGLSKLQNAIVQNYENGVGNALIKGQTNNQSVQYDYIGTLEGVDYYDWTGNTFGPVANKMYMIYTSEAIASEDFMIEGEKVDYENTTIALFQGWNWISYPLDEPTLINEALKNFTGATTGDQIKWYGTGFVTYANGKWYPENFKMMPGEGYMYKAAKQGSFMYSKGTGNNRSDANANMTVENSHWSPEISQYANNMTITAMLSVDDEIVKGDYEIAAFANGECRGSARPIYVEELDAYVLLMAVFGEDVEELTFKYYDVNYETEYELSNRINYSNDAVVGSIDEPYMFNLDILNIGETSVENISIYPNPTTTGSEINLQAVCDKVEVFNALGVKIAEYSNVDSIDAIETAGVYVIRLTIDNSARNCRLIVK